MTSSVVTMESLVTASQGFQRYVFAWGDGGQESGLVESEAIVVMKRSGGLLLALPLDVLPEDVLDQGRLSRDGDLVGPSTILSVQGMISDSLGLAPIGATLPVLVVDFKEAVLDHLRLPEEGDEFIVGFSEDDVDAFPHLPELVSEAFGWLESQASVGRVSSYTPEVTAESGGEGGLKDQPSLQRKAKARPKGATPPGAEGASPLGKTEKPKKPTTAGLASAVEALSSTLEAVLKRQQIMEEKMNDPPNPTTAALRKPLAAQVPPQGVAVSSLAREFQSPNVRSSASLIPWVSAKNEAPQELVELEKEKPQPSGSTLADAMMAQSVALTTCTGGSTFLGSVGPTQRADRWIKHGSERSSGTGSITGRAGQQQGTLLRVGDEIHVSEDVSHFGVQHAPGPNATDGDLRDKILGEIWRLWEVQRPWHHPAPSDDHTGLLPVQQPRGGKGHHSPSGGDDRANRFGSGPDGAGASVMPGRRPPSFDLQQQECSPFSSIKGFQSIGGSAVGDNSLGLSQRVGHHNHQKVRADRSDNNFFEWWWGTIRSPKGESKPKEEVETKAGRAREGGGRRMRKKVDAERTGGMAESSFGGESTCQLDRCCLDPSFGDSKVPHVQRLLTSKDNDALGFLEEEIDFVTWAICLPRWLVSTRSDFSSFLTWSFSVKRQGLALHSVVYPLPIPFEDCFGCSGPGLSRKNLRRLALKRVTHIVCMALNFLYFGSRPSSIDLRRPPGTLQLQCIRRLYNHLAACGSREERFPIAPSRSGPELVASLKKLEDFIAASPDMNDPYTRSGEGTRVRSEMTEEVLMKYPQIRPFRSLDACRLKLNGTGDWPLERYLSGPLWLPYVEPDILFHGFSTKGCPMPLLHHEEEKDYWELAMRWEALGLLRLCDEPVGDQAFVKVFNAYKDANYDREIGDRRRVNYMERHLGGPSSHLPGGPLLIHLYVPKRKVITGSVTDRRDFYHQCQVTWERTATNVVPFEFPLEAFEGTNALKTYQERQKELAKKGREIDGDHLGEGGKKRSEQRSVYPAFGALFQGDHLGVEFALGGHEGLLTEENLLQADHRLQGHCPIPRTDVWQALIIDDFFVISVQDEKTSRTNTEAFRLLERARAAYAKHRLKGSPEKDITAEKLFKAAGAEVDGRDQCLRRNLCLVAAPLAKRIGLATLSLRVANLHRVTATLAARLTGGWVSVLLYRRCLSSIVEELFALGNYKEKAEADAVRVLSRKAAQELQMLAVLSPLMATNVRAGFSTTLFATDASLGKGAIVETDISEDWSRLLWDGCSKQGHYTMLDSPFRELLKHVGEEVEEDGETAVPCPDPDKQLPFFFDFVEICGGVGAVSEAMTQLGAVVAPVLDLSRSRQYNIKSTRMLEWIFYMIEENRFASLLLAPPCTSFSPAAHPAVRSYQQPLGFNRKHPKVLHGNGLAFRSMLVCRHAKRHRRPTGLEQPRLSKMAWLTSWLWLKKIGMEEAVIAACQFNSIHKKEFRLLCYELDVKRLDRRCQGGHAHVRIEGRYTKASAIYTPEMAMHLAGAFVESLQRLRAESNLDQPREGKESCLINDWLVAKAWKLRRAWAWKRKAHINVYETSVVCSLLKEMVAKHPEKKVNILVDSQVALGCINKGRSSAKTLQPVLQRAAALQLAGGLFPGLSYAPTRLIPADHPTRDREIPDAVPYSLTKVLPDIDWQLLHAQKIPRAYANWVRLSSLAILIHPSEALHFDFNSFNDPSWLGFSLSLLLPCFALSLGFALAGGFVCKGLWCLSCHMRVFRSFVAMAVLFQLVAAPMAPATLAEEARAAARFGIKLASDRLIKRETRENRAVLLADFETWLWGEHSVSWESLFGTRPLDPERISKWLADYGRDLHRAGKAYGKYAETINGVGMLKPIIKRQLTPAWDVAFAWLQDEPYEHHPAMPLSVILSVVTLSLLWGWATEGALFAMCWAGILRVGELVGATRADLVLPGDGIPGMRNILFKIKEPKSRGRAARHQAARIDPEDFVLLISAVFRNFSPTQLLWSMSVPTLRKRLMALLGAIGLPTSKKGTERPYELSSLRPGGATFLLNLTENPDLVRRRGRWASLKVMEIYLQEISFATGVSRLDEDVKSRIERLSSAFGQVLLQAVNYLDCAVPCTAWPHLFKHHQRREGTG